MKMKHNVSRLLSLLLVVAALAGLLSVSALAADEAPEVTLKVVNTTANPVAGQPVTVSVYLSGLQEGVVVQAVTFSLSCPDGFYLDNIDEEDGKTEDMTSELPSSKGTNVIGNNGNNMTYFYTTTSSKNVVGNGEDILVSNITIQTPKTVYGNVTIGILATGLNVANDDRTFNVGTTAATLTFPSATLTFVDEKFNTTTAPQTVAVGGTVTEPTAPTATGYTFGGWYTDEDCNTEFNFSTPLNDSTTVYAKWTANTYTVTFDTDGGSLPEGVASTKTVTYYQPYGELPTPTKNGYKFTGWEREGTKIPVVRDNIVDLADDHTLTATWADKYDITIDSTTETFTVGKENICYTVTATVVGSDVAAPTDYTVSYFVDGEWQSAAPTKPGSYAVKITRDADDDFKAVDVSIDPGLVINKKSVAEPKQGDSSFTYDALTHSFVYTNSDDSALYTVTTESTTSAKEVGTYTITFKLNNTEDYQWKTKENSDDLVFTYTINKAEVEKPSLTQSSFDYDGAPKTVTLNPADAKYALDKDTATATDAGSYKAKVTLSDTKNYKWAGEAADVTEIELPFTIHPKKVAAPTKDTTEFTYDGSKKTYGINSTDDYKVEGNEETDAGEYTVTVILKDKKNTVWADDSTTADKTFDFVIAKATVAAPAKDTTEFTYDGNKKTYGIHSTDDYDVKGNEKTDAGEYTVIVSLKDKKNTVWADDSTTADKTFTFVIAKADKTAPTGLTAEAESIKGKDDGKISGLNDTMEYSADNTTWTAIGGKKLENLAAGTYYVRYAENENYKASESAAVTVGKGAPIVVKFVTGDAEVTVADQELGYEENVAEPEATRIGYKLDGWYKEDNFKHLWNFAEDTVTKDITLYAKWSYSVAVSGDNSFTIGSEPEKGLTIEIGKGLTLSGSFLGKVKVDNKTLNEADYTVSDENGLTVTLSKQFLASLKAGTHTVTIALDDKNSSEELSVDFTVNEKAAESGTAGSGSAKKDDTKKAPHTGDESDLLLWSVITLGAGAGLVCIGKKRREN